MSMSIGTSLGQWRQPRRSCRINLEKKLENFNFTLVTFLNIQGDFNNVNLESIHNALYESGISSILI